MRHCVYITIGETGKFYVGKTTEKQINKGYQGSGRVIKDYLKTHKAFTFVVQWFDTSKEAFDAEAKFVDDNLLSHPDCLNLVPGGCGGNKLEWTAEQRIAAGIRKPRLGAKLSEETKDKIGDGNRGKRRTQQQKTRLEESLKSYRYDAENFEKRSASSKKTWVTRKARATNETRQAHSDAAKRGHETRKLRKAQKGV